MQSFTAIYRRAASIAPIAPEKAATTACWVAGSLATNLDNPDASVMLASISKTGVDYRLELTDVLCKVLTEAESDRYYGSDEFVSRAEATKFANLLAERAGLTVLTPSQTKEQVARVTFQKAHQNA